MTTNFSVKIGEIGLFTLGYNV